MAGGARRAKQLRGWSAYFGYGAGRSAYRAIDNHVLTRVRKFLGRRQKLHGRGTRRSPVEAVNGNIGVYHIRFAHYRGASASRRPQQGREAVLKLTVSPLPSGRSRSAGTRR